MAIKYTDSNRSESSELQIVPLPFRHKIGYSTGQLVELIVGSMLNMFALFYVTVVCGLPGALAGLALGVGMVVDAVMDPLLGSLSDGRKSRLGRRVPFMIMGIIPLIITFNLIFALPSSLSDMTLFLWLTALSISLRVSLSIFATPYQALGAEISDDYQERSSIAVWRWGIGILGTAAVIGLGFGVFLSGPDGLSQREGYLPLTLTLTVLLLAGALSSIWAGLATRNRQRETAAPTLTLRHRLLSEIREMFRNRTFRVLFSASILLNVAQGVNQALAVHTGIFFWGLSSSQLQLISLSGVFGLMLAAPLAGPISQRIEKRTLFVASLIGLALAQGAPASLRLIGLLPFTGDDLVAVLIAISFVGGMMFALSVIAIFSIIPDAVDEHEHIFHTRREGLYNAGWGFASKTASGAGLLVSGFVLQLIQFPAGVSESSAAEAIPAQTINLLGLAGGPLPGLIALLGTAIMVSYRLDKKAHARLMVDLAARRGA